MKNILAAAGLGALGACTGSVGKLEAGGSDSAAAASSLRVSRVSPDEGPPEGGTAVTVIGSGFIGSMGVDIGAQACVDVTQISASELSCVTPANVAGEYVLTVTRLQDGETAVSSFVYVSDGSDGTGTGDAGTGGGTASGDGTGGGTGGDGTGGGTAGDGGGGGAPVAVDYCHLQYPCSVRTSTGSASNLVYVWVYQAGVTEGVGQGPGVMVDIGIGPHESDPSDPAWVWSSASYNEDKDGLSPLANDEYEGELVTPVSPGVFDYCGRVSVDGGLSWTYCDAGGVTCVGDGSLDGYQSANAGVLTVR